jgi:hypothetical protein
MDGEHRLHPVAGARAARKANAPSRWPAFSASEAPGRVGRASMAALWIAVMVPGSSGEAGVWVGGAFIWGAP